MGEGLCWRAAARAKLPVCLLRAQPQHWKAAGALVHADCLQPRRSPYLVVWDPGGLVSAGTPAGTPWLMFHSARWGHAALGICACRTRGTSSCSSNSTPSCILGSRPLLGGDSWTQSAHVATELGGKREGRMHLLGQVIQRSLEAPTGGRRLSYWTLGWNLLECCIPVLVPYRCV